MPVMSASGSDNLFVSYFAHKDPLSNYENGYGELRYAKNSFGSWQVSIAVDPQGKVHIGYFDNRSGSLKYATNKWE
jgi:hypothetical protein